MLIKGPGELRKIKNIGTSDQLKHNEICTKWDIAKASGDPRHFNDGDLFERLIKAKVFVETWNGSLSFNRKRLYDIYEDLDYNGIKIQLKFRTPLRW